MIEIYSWSYKSGLQAFVDGGTLVWRGCKKCKRMDNKNGEIASDLFKNSLINWWDASTDAQSPNCPLSHHNPFPENTSGWWSEPTTGMSNYKQ